MYEVAKQYYSKYGNIHIPQGKKYKKYELGSWIHTQRRKSGYAWYSVESRKGQMGRVLSSSKNVLRTDW